MCAHEQHEKDAETSQNKSQETSQLFVQEYSPLGFYSLQHLKITEVCAKMTHLIVLRAFHTNRYIYKH